MTAIHLIIGSLQRLHVFGVENRDTLTHKATGVSILNCVLSKITRLHVNVYLFLRQYSAKLLKKPEQCRAVYACSHLFWVDDQDSIKDGERCFILRLAFIMKLLSI